MISTFRSPRCRHPWDALNKILYTFLTSSNTRYRTYTSHPTRFDNPNNMQTENVMYNKTPKEPTYTEGDTGTDQSIAIVNKSTATCDWELQQTDDSKLPHIFLHFPSRGTSTPPVCSLYLSLDIPRCKPTADNTTTLTNTMLSPLLGSSNSNHNHQTRSPAGTISSYTSTCRMTRGIALPLLPQPLSPGCILKYVRWVCVRDQQN